MIEELLKKETSWERLARADKPVVVYGTGNGADMVFDECGRLGIKISGVFASSSFVRSRTFRGLQVCSLEKIEEQFESFIVAVAFASSIPDVMNGIYAVAEKHETVVPCVPVYGSEIFNRELVLKNAGKLEKAYSLMADETSRSVFEGAVEFMLTGELNVLKRITTPKEEAFENILRLGKDEKYLDLGAYRGDTVEEFLHFSGGEYSSITAVEPDRKSFSKLNTYLENIDSSKAVNACIGEKCGTVLFASGGGRQSALNKNGSEAQCVTVDSLCAHGVSYIKADVEGSEPEMLAGAVNTLCKFRPKLNLAVYHRSEDIFSLPLLINSIEPGYKIYLRKHPYIPCWDMNLYCI